MIIKWEICFSKSCRYGIIRLVDKRVDIRGKKWSLKCCFTNFSLKYPQIRKYFQVIHKRKVTIWKFLWRRIKTLLWIHHSIDTLILKPTPISFCVGYFMMKILMFWFFIILHLSFVMYQTKKKVRIKNIRSVRLRLILFQK